MKKEGKRMLPVALTDDERATKAQELVKALADYDATEEEKKERTKDLTAQMKDLRNKFTTLRREVASGKTDRLVDTWTEPNIVRRCWVVIRADTGDVVEDYPMTEQEIAAAQQIDWTREKGKRAGGGADDKASG